MQTLKSLLFREDKDEVMEQEIGVSPQGASPDDETTLRMVSLSWLGSVKQDDNWKKQSFWNLVNTKSEKEHGS